MDYFIEIVPNTILLETELYPVTTVRGTRMCDDLKKCIRVYLKISCEHMSQQIS